MAHPGSLLGFCSEDVAEQVVDMEELGNGHESMTGSCCQLACLWAECTVLGSGLGTRAP